jgi:hypothetical protein
MAAPLLTSCHVSEGGWPEPTVGNFQQLRADACSNLMIFNAACSTKTANIKRLIAG